MISSERFVVITTINDPSEAIYRFSSWSNWHLLVVGDRKTPSDWRCNGVTYLDLDRQYREFGELARALPENSYTRKVLGYAYAIQHGAKAILESDDDNIPYADAESTLDELVTTGDRLVGVRLRGDQRWLNVYHAFGVPHCWPHGFPLEHIKDSPANQTSGTDSKPWAIVQFLADEDPDVDAIYRMVDSRPAYFARQHEFTLDAGTFCPVNSQATLWLPEAFPLLFLPLGVADRVTDILRGYVATAALWQTGHAVSFGSPVLHQKRNAHNLHRDFQQETPLYVNADRWACLLLDINTSSVIDSYRRAIAVLIAKECAFSARSQDATTIVEKAWRYRGARPPLLSALALFAS